MPVNAAGDLSPARRRPDEESAAIGRADLARDQAAGGQPIEDAGQRRALVREAAMQMTDRRRARRRQMGEDVRLALRQRRPLRHP